MSEGAPSDADRGGGGGGGGGGGEAGAPFYGYSVKRPPPLSRLRLPCAALFALAEARGVAPQAMAAALLAMPPDELSRTAEAARADARAAREGAGRMAGGGAARAGPLAGVEGRAPQPQLQPQRQPVQADALDPFDL